MFLGSNWALIFGVHCITTNLYFACHAKNWPSDERSEVLFHSITDCFVFFELQCQILKHLIVVVSIYKKIVDS